jgi:hypothetical protein
MKINAKKLAKKVYKCDFCSKELNLKSHTVIKQHVFKGHNKLDFERTTWP